MLSTVPRLQLIPQLANLDPAYLGMVLAESDKGCKLFTKQNLEAAQWTDFLDGQETPYLNLRQKPAWLQDSQGNPLLTVFFDPAGYYGQVPGGFASTTQMTLGADYVLEVDSANGLVSKSARLLRIGGSATSTGFVGVWPEVVWQGKLAARRRPTWPLSYGSIKAVYYAGYGTVNGHTGPGDFGLIPPDLQGACEKLAALIARNKPSGGEMSTESLGAYSYSIITGQQGNVAELDEIRAVLRNYRDSTWGVF